MGIWTTSFGISEPKRKGEEFGMSSSRRRKAAARPIVTRIVSKFQTTVPPEIRKIYGLNEGDLIEWTYDEETGKLVLCPKRAHLLTPQVRREIADIRSERSLTGQTTTHETQTAAMAAG